MRYFDKIEQIQTDYLEKKIEDAEKNTNVFTEDKFIRIHRFQFDYIHRCCYKKAGQVCVLVVFKYNKQTFPEQVEKIYELQQQFKECFFVVASDIDQVQYDSEVQKDLAYSVNIVNFNSGSDVPLEDYRYIISDPYGVQQNSQQGYDELVAELQTKMKVEFIQPMCVNAKRSNSLVFRGRQLVYLTRFKRSFAQKCLIIVCPEVTQQILDLLIMATGKQMHACLMCEQLSLKNIEEFL